MGDLKVIENFRGVHQGKRLFLLASGPSISGLNFEPLQRRLVMGLNRSFLLFPDTHYQCCMDQRLFDLYPEMLKKSRYLFTLRGRPWGIQLNLLGGEGFSFDLSAGIYSGYTISYMALQVAVYMGFKELVYLGLDLKHDSGRTHFFGADFHSRNHEDTEFPRMLRMLQRGAQEAAKENVKLFNCSPVSVIDGFENITYEEALNR
ncbi:MAG: hypothetical protein J5J00_11665 [Deltaproteobacteria bacterium]|nr:hypothetical protein [Deltaproteobacteria bacterium]